MPDNGIYNTFFFCLRFFVQPRDAYLYERFIINWEKNGRIIDKIEYFPLSLWLMKLPHDLFGFEIMKGGIIVNILLGLGIIIIGMKTAEIVFHNRVTTLFVGLILATHPTIVSLSCSFLRDTAYLFFGTASLYFFAVYWKKEDLFSLIANSMLATFSFLCRLEGFEITVIFSAILLFLAISRKEKKIRVVFRFFLYYAIFLATMLLTCICLGLSEKNYNHITIRINRQIINRFISF